jgi:C1A family cysteine protease
MFKLLLLVTSFLSVFSADFNLRKRELTTFLNEGDEWKQFTNFQDRFSKRYENMQEMETRFQIFRTNLRNIILHNLDYTQNFTMGINQFTDLTPQEFKDQYVGGLKAEVGSYGCKTFSSSASGAPSSVDWRNKGAVTSVKDQGQCGSCWAFATTANAESVWAIAKGPLYDLSEQYLVDCSSGAGYYNMGCNGGNPDSAFKYMINNGQCTDASYPYTSGVSKTAGTCHACTKASVSYTSCSDVKANDQVSLKGAVAMKPVVIAIEADTAYFQSYQSGILTSTKCGTNLDHAVEIIGYGEENGTKYWTVRNSWGPTWGENGYVRILRSDSTNDIGICGVAAQPSFLNV